jgi:type VI secretion system secreted protein VgrG
MGWTRNRTSRTTRRRHRPQLELLDDRCLLSASAGTKLTDHAALLAASRQHAQLRLPHAGATRAERAAAAHAKHAAASTILEQPTGSLITGAATAYDPIVGAAQTRIAYNVDGKGMTVAVIDTGVDYNNEALGGGFGPSAKVVAGYDFSDNSADPMATSSQHGTAIAGLIGSSDPNDLGVAPGVNIVALRVTDSSNTASLSSIARALQWVINNHEQYNISAVNMSLSDGGNYAQNWFASDGSDGQQVTNLIAQLTAMNIPVVAATGNSFSGQQGEGFAAIVAGTISVTATDLSGHLLSNAQRLGSAIGGTSATTIAAPGEGLTAPSGDSGTATVEGTSFAAALATGAVTLLQEIYHARFGALPSVAQLTNWLQQGSNPVHDPVTGITIGELNIAGSASLIPVPHQSTSPAPASTQTNAQAPAATIQVSTSPASSAPVSAISTAVATATPGVQVFVNGQQIDAAGSTTSGALAGIDQASLAGLFWAMNAWAAGGSVGMGHGVTQIQIWSA